MSSSAPAAAPFAAASLHVVYAEHDLNDAKTADEGQGVNKPIVRKQMILEALQHAAEKGNSSTAITFAALNEPAPSLQPAERVHSAQLLGLFATGFARWEALGPEGRDMYFSTAGRVTPPDWSELVPSQCAPRDPYQRPGSSVHGEVLYYAQDRQTPITAHTSRILHHDMAVTLNSVEAILAGKQQVYACASMPGHHSGRESYGGYCFINHAALATKLLQEKLDKVALIDVDYHAGNGSMSIFYRDGDVLFSSLHADPSIEYPYCSGWADQTGEGAGEGTTINVPLPKGTDWAAYKPQLARVLAAVTAFGAKALVVSLGVDTLAGDPECAPLAGFSLGAPGDYEELGAMVRALQLPTLWVQEGGYYLSEGKAGEAVKHVLVGQ